MTSPIKYYGGKAAIAKKVIALFPSHERYVEVFGGSGSSLFAKRPSKVEVLNDIDGELVNFFGTLKTNGEGLRDRLELTLYSRSEYDLARDEYSDTEDPVERAARYFLLVQQSLNGRYNGGWSRDFHQNRAKVYFHAVAKLTAAVKRLQGVVVENRDFRQLIPEFDAPDVLFYCDPPYVPETRVEVERYRHEMSAHDHEELLELITETKAMVVLSGYPSPLYDNTLDGWDRQEIVVPNAADVKNIGAKGSKRGQKSEIVWRNRAAVASCLAVPEIDFS